MIDIITLRIRMTISRVKEVNKTEMTLFGRTALKRLLGSKIVEASHTIMTVEMRVAIWHVMSQVPNSLKFTGLRRLLLVLMDIISLLPVRALSSCSGT
jgi:hypothetical protein